MHKTFRTLHFTYNFTLERRGHCYFIGISKQIPALRVTPTGIGSIDRQIECLMTLRLSINNFCTPAQVTLKCALWIPRYLYDSNNNYRRNHNRHEKHPFL